MKKIIEELLVFLFIFGSSWFCINLVTVVREQMNDDPNGRLLLVAVICTLIIYIASNKNK